MPSSCIIHANFRHNTCERGWSMYFFVAFVCMLIMFDFAPIHTDPGSHPASYTMGTGSIPGGKAAGTWR
jgi:hypothetical protein